MQRLMPDSACSVAEQGVQQMFSKSFIFSGLALAAPIFAAMAKDEALPPSMRSRAMQMAGALGVDAVQAEDTGEAPAATKEDAE